MYNQRNIYYLKWIAAFLIAIILKLIGFLDAVSWEGIIVSILTVAFLAAAFRFAKKSDNE